MKILQVSNIVKEYNGKSILSDIYIECKTGEIIGLLGRNGEGKTTLLEIIFGSKKSNQKNIRIDNINININKKYIAYISRENFLPGSIKVKSIIDIICPDKKEVLYENLIIKPLLNKYCREIRTEEKKIITILSFIHSESDFILIDEPFYGLSPNNCKYLTEYLRNNSRDKGIIITDHDYEVILNLSHQTLLLSKGSIKKINDKNDLRFYKFIR